MNCKPGIDKNLVADGLLFTTSGHRCRYLGTSNREKARWLEDNEGNYQRVDDVLQRLGRPDNVGPALTGQNCETSSRDIRKDCGDGENGSLVAPLPEQCSAPHQPTSRPEGVTVAHVVELLQTAYPKIWKQLLRNRLGAADPADLTPAELAGFIDHVFWLVKQTGIRDPAALLVFRAQLDATAAPAKPGSPVENSDIAVQWKSAEREAVPLENNPATTAASPPQPVARTVAIGTTKAEMLSREAAVEVGESPRDIAERLAPAGEDEAEGPKIEETTPFGTMGAERGHCGGRQLKKQKLRGGASKTGRKLSPKRMRIVLESLRERPVLWHAASKAGIHRKTLEYWIKRSTAGDAGYDIEWEGVMWRFHEHCEAARAEAHDKVLAAAWDMAMGGAVYKTDPVLVYHGYEGPDAYATDENGNFIVEAVRRPNFKMIRFLLQWALPEKWGKHRKSDIPRTGGVLVIGKRTEKPENSCAATIKARQWKARSREIEKAKS
jgi:hypothetical protein